MNLATDTHSIARRYVAAVQAADEQALEELFAPDATWTLAAGNLPIAGTWRGRHAILNEFLTLALSHYQPGSIEIEVARTIAEGDHVVMQWTSRARTRTGRSYENECIAVFTIQDGRIRAVREYMDTLYARDRAFAEVTDKEVMHTTVVTSLQHHDLNQEDLGEDVVFHSPVTDYHGRGDVAHLLSTIASVVDAVSAERQLAWGREVITEVTMRHQGHCMTGLVSERYDDDGRVQEATLLLRPLWALNETINAMRAALERSPLPSHS
jgi:uncharacterized protein (TIGR02246 family)